MTRQKGFPVGLLLAMVGVALMVSYLLILQVKRLETQSPVEPPKLLVDDVAALREICAQSQSRYHENWLKATEAWRQMRGLYVVKTAFGQIGDLKSPETSAEINQICASTPTDEDLNSPLTVERAVFLDHYAVTMTDYLHSEVEKLPTSELGQVLEILKQAQRLKEARDFYVDYGNKQAKESQTKDLLRQADAEYELVVKALSESRWDDASRHIEESKRLFDAAADLLVKEKLGG